MNGVDTSLFYHGKILNKLVLHILEKTDLFKQYPELCQPIEFENNYNIRLIGLIMGIKNYALAEKYCLEQISRNYYEEYNVPYWILLKEIYTINGIRKGMDDMSSLLLPYSYNMADYQTIMDGLPTEEERKKYRSHFLARARSKSRKGNLAASSFLFQLFDKEKSYNKILNEIDSSTPYTLLLAYFDVLYNHDKEAFLEKLLSIDTDASYLIKDDEVHQDKLANEEALVTVMAARYTKKDIEKSINKTGRIFRHFFSMGESLKDKLLMRWGKKES